MMIPRIAWASSPAIWGNVEKIELLPYHELGKHKWVAMGEEYKLDGVHPPKKETMERVKGILEQYGHKVMY
ncbi:Pyruvate formate-lyase 1-activating enzyme [Cedecea neteri]|uniref:Pyruvate formate-lyase 1-activating enzyme n=1 Tax=Cedecea neteri TaxID=158822 RepID=A0A2X2T1P6_9ENTR|nr:Pyruvate formate-lyase 1-activating enzyme [Cedecea neteri]